MKTDNEQTAEETEAKKGRGRPKGSPSKMKMVVRTVRIPEEWIELINEHGLSTTASGYINTAIREKLVRDGVL